MQKEIMRFRGKHILEISKLPSVNRMSLKAQVSLNTVIRYINTSEKVKECDLSIFLRLLMDGCDLSKEQILALPLGEVFEIVEADTQEPAPTA